MSATLTLSYPQICQYFTNQTGKGRTESRAFLAWFLEHFYRLDPDLARDCICDGPDDKGVDGVYVDDNLESIDIFQSRLYKGATKSIGDVALKEFLGTLAQFKDGQGIDNLVKTTSNQELAKLITSEEVAKKIVDGYGVRGVFVTNVPGDRNADNFLSLQPRIVLYDSKRLAQLYVPLGPTGPMTKAVKFKIQPDRLAMFKINGTRVFMVSLKAKELVLLDGIASCALFAWNVRQSLGRTKVNKEIGLSVEDLNEHKNFLLYHNGLTVLAKSIRKTRSTMTISGYTVVNGCQSLTTLYEHRGILTDELEILTRLIELSPDNPLAAKIIHHSNNQNPISARDLQSNSSVQRRLQKEFQTVSPNQIFYRIKRGETTNIPKIIDNQDAARFLLAFDLEEPWTCHQTYKLFDELHAQIFARPEVNAHRIIALDLVFDAVMQSMVSLENDLTANYTLTRYILLYLLRQALETDSQGKNFCKDPSPFLFETNGETRLKLCMRNILNDLVIDLNAEIKQRQDSQNPLDYKREFKSPTAVKSLERSVIPPYQMAVSRKRAASFAEEWEKSAK